MLVELIVVCLLMVLAGGCGLLALIRNNPRWLLGTVLGLFGSFGMLLTFEHLSPFVNAGSIIAKDGHIVEVVAKRTRFWLRDIEDCKILSCAPQTVEMSVSPITDNPKVRELHYRVRVGIPTDSTKFQLFWDEVEVKSGGLQQWLRCQLYDLNEEKSKELAKLWNPLRLEQQYEFHDLVKGFLIPRLDKVGLTFGHASFSLP